MKTSTRDFLNKGGALRRLFLKIQLRYRDIRLSHKCGSEMKYNIIIKGIAFIYLLLFIIKGLK